MKRCWAAANRRKVDLGYASTDWETAYKRLWIYASGLAQNAPDIFDGVSVHDLVNETMLTFLASPTALDWDAKKGALADYLCGVLRHKFLDHLKRQRFVAGSVDDHAIRDTFRCRYSAERELAAKEWIEHVINKLSAHGDLQEVVVAAAEATDGGHNSNQQIADALGTSASEVANRKKRILRILGRGSR